MGSEDISPRAERVRRIAAGLDLRLLMVLVSALGLCSWLLPWPCLIAFGPSSFVAAWAAWRLRAIPRGAVKAYAAFLILWTLAKLLSSLLEAPGAWGPAVYSALELGSRLAVMAALALAVPLAATAVEIGRAAGWLLGPMDRLLGLFRKKEAESDPGLSWRAALAVCLMMSFLPRAIKAVGQLRQALLLRAPSMSSARRLRLLAETLIRVMGSQAWDAALAITARDLYRPEPWSWPKGKSF
ncbi:MAG: hypothetical protein LBE49_07620 [Deltaproteobacteria bacterium]|jgi:biotin transport system permease protein|nr:hypothetical protein [Deltaproteobacteria bacterium]